MAERVRVAGVSEVATGEVRAVVASGMPIALANVDGALYAVASGCLHRGGPLGEGDLDGGEVICPWHGWRWDVRTGRSTNNPALALSCFPVTVADGAVYVDV